MDLDRDLYNFTREINTTGNYVIIGDFNFPDIYWRANVTNNSVAQVFLPAIADGFLHCIVKESTEGEAILDLVLLSSIDVLRELT